MHANRKATQKVHGATHTGAVSTRLRQWREQAGLEVEDIAARLNLSLSYLYQLERGEKRLNETVLHKLAKEYGVSSDYLLGLEKWVSSRQIPLIGTARAGIPVLNEGNITGYIEIPADVRADFAVQVEGDSMSWVGIHHGDIAICRLQETARSGQIVAVSLEEDGWGATIKFYVEHGGRRWLRSANPSPEYRDILLDDKPHRIAGIVVKILKEPPGMRVYEDMVATYQGLADWASVVAEAAALGMQPEDLKRYLEVVRTAGLKMK